MKKKILSILACILLLPAILLVGCGPKKDDHAINMSRYFKADMKYEIYNNQTQKETKLTEFTHNLHDNSLQYWKLIVTGQSEWLYKMTIEKVTFDIYANEDAEVQFILRFSNLENGDLDTKSDPKFKTIVEAKKNKPVKVTFNVNDIVGDASTTTLRIEIDGAQHFTDDNKDFAYDIMNLQVYGEHKN